MTTGLLAASRPLWPSRDRPREDRTCRRESCLLPVLDGPVQSPGKRPMTQRRPPPPRSPREDVGFFRGLDAAGGKGGMPVSAAAGLFSCNNSSSFRQLGHALAPGVFRASQLSPRADDGAIPRAERLEIPSLTVQVIVRAIPRFPGIDTGKNLFTAQATIRSPSIAAAARSGGTPREASSSCRPMATLAHADVLHLVLGRTPFTRTSILSPRQ